MSDPISNQPVIQLSNVAMQETIQKLLASGKGILAADARIKSMGKRLEAIGVEPTPENALKFRGILRHFLVWVLPQLPPNAYPCFLSLRRQPKFPFRKLKVFVWFLAWQH